MIDFLNSFLPILIYLLLIILIIIGILLIFYPVIGKFVSKIGQTSAIEKYKEKIIQMDDEEKENIRKKDAKNTYIKNVNISFYSICTNSLLYS